MFFAEVLLRLANLGTLKVTDLDGNFIERAAENGEGADVGCMAIALDDLGCDGSRLETELLADALFVLRLEVSEGAHGARELADAHVLCSSGEARKVTLHFGIPVEQLEAEGRGLGMNAVRTADGGRVLEFEGPPLQDGKQRFNSLLNES